MVCEFFGTVDYVAEDEDFECIEKDQLGLRTTYMWFDNQDGLDFDVKNEIRSYFERKLTTDNVGCVRVEIEVDRFGKVLVTTTVYEKHR